MLSILDKIGLPTCDLYVAPTALIFEACYSTLSFFYGAPTFSRSQRANNGNKNPSYAQGCGKGWSDN